MLVATKLQRNQDHEESITGRSYISLFTDWTNYWNFFLTLLKINKVAEMTIDSQINLLIHGIDCFFG